MIFRLWKYYSGSLNTIIFDIEGIRVQNKKNGLQKSFTWDQNPNFTVQDDADDNPGYIIIHVVDSDERISISIDKYTNLMLGDKMIERTKKAFDSFKTKYRASLK